MAHPWHDLPNHAESCHEHFNAVIEIPKGCKVKYELDKPSGLLRVDRVLYSSVIYPANYGFLPRSYCDDNDPLDVLVLGYEAVQPLCIMQVRAIGVMRMLDEGKADDKVIGVHIHDPAFNEYTDIAQLSGHLFREIRRFFEDYKALEKKSVQVEEIEGSTAAIQVVRDALRLYREKENVIRGWG